VLRAFVVFRSVSSDPVKRLAGKNVYKVTYFLLSETINLNFAVIPHLPSPFIFVNQPLEENVTKSKYSVVLVKVSLCQLAVVVKNCLILFECNNFTAHMPLLMTISAC